MAATAERTPGGAPEERPEGTPCWADVLLPDLEAGKRFYGELFGWTFAEGGGIQGPYATALSDGLRVAGLAPKGDGRMPTAWGVYLATADAVALAARVREAGGQVITEPVRVGAAGVTALVADPGGAVFGVWQAGEHTGFEKEGLPGSYCWTEVYTRARDKDAVDAFYTALFGYRTRDLDDPSADFRVWSPAGTGEPTDADAIGGRSVIGGVFPAEMPAHFLVYFAVADCDETVAATLRLGGRVTEEPFDTPYGRIALLADDQGAAFAVLAEPKAA
ncbi:VOC family protein [Streptomyces somaliensis DSM 40738]|uniref:VOC family protein n=1 Tax=Streptomyces somaliensis (strain ATCC 33201 / DSM 40738 / JCM 12659 / KCTC 9044 / NCTC 11332 / NRRL B-12077 / IP 733) TaxID=1134445 RepID=A0AA44DFY2_STRE0|nr:VOC family protein [Streptomyces somaliensis]MCQ0023196.1 VOC family protein [Streptomyces somaliensis DSM 40738]NKY16183.1 VOC family protein [Streptomyces somaliensis DSM 40738]